MNRIHDTGTALIEAEVHLAELATGPKAGRPDYVGFLSSADAVALRDELAALRTRLAVSTSAAPTGAAAPTREVCVCGHPRTGHTDTLAGRCVTMRPWVPGRDRVCECERFRAASPAGRAPAETCDPILTTDSLARWSARQFDKAQSKRPTREDGASHAGHTEHGPLSPSGAEFSRPDSGTADTAETSPAAGRAPARAGTTEQLEQQITTLTHALLVARDDRDTARAEIARPPAFARAGTTELTPTQLAEWRAFLDWAQSDGVLDDDRWAGRSVFEAIRTELTELRAALHTGTRNDSVLVGHHINCAFVRAWLRSETAECTCADARRAEVSRLSARPPTDHQQDEG